MDLRCPSLSSATTASGTWTLYFGDRYGGWTMYFDLEAQQPIDVIIAEIRSIRLPSSGVDYDLKDRGSHLHHSSGRDPSRSSERTIRAPPASSSHPGCERRQIVDTELLRLPPRIEEYREF